MNSNKAFILYKLPNKPQIYLIRHSINKGLKAQIVSFNKQKTVNICAENIKQFLNFKELNKEKIKYTLLELNKEKSFNKTSYLNKVNNIIKQLQNSDIAKVVFSRKKRIKSTSNPYNIFKNLCLKNPNSFCYWLYTQENENWVGASPETLLLQENNQLTTMSLAGTLPLQENWTDKEKQEQEIVTKYIVNKLQKLGLKVKVSTTKELLQNNFKHLVKHITALNINSPLNTILSVLHPTPAVCGLPIEKAKLCIQQNENYNREFYTGYITVFIENKSKTFVNLRCAKVFKNGVDIYVGGGILPNSNPEKEWQETELKAQIIQQAIKTINN